MNSPASAPANTATGRFHRRYANTAKAISAPTPWMRPASRISPLKAPPVRSTEMKAATTSQYSAAPGLRIRYPPSTPASSQAPPMRGWYSGTAAKMVLAAGLTPISHTQNTTAQATATTDTITISFTRHVRRDLFDIFPPVVGRGTASPRVCGRGYRE